MGLVCLSGSDEMKDELFEQHLKVVKGFTKAESALEHDKDMHSSARKRKSDVASDSRPSDSRDSGAVRGEARARVDRDGGRQTEASRHSPPADRHRDYMTHRHSSGTHDREADGNTRGTHPHSTRTTHASTFYSHHWHS